jgi:hypothetical protein
MPGSSATWSGRKKPVTETPVRRVYQVYLYAVCLVAVLVFLFAASLALFGLVRVALPDQTAAEGQFLPGPVPEEIVSTGSVDVERKQGLAQFLNNAILSGIAGLVFRLHWRRAGTLRAGLEEAGEP